MKDKFKIEEYFSDREIIKILCKKRALAAKKLHDNHFLRNITRGAKTPHNLSAIKIFNYFPPRSKWIRLNHQEREKRNTNAVDINSIQIERTVWRERKKIKTLGYSNPEWLNNLNTLIAEIQKNVLSNDSNYDIPKPKTIPVIKDKNKKEYRPISSFHLSELIIISQVSRYLTNCFDQLFLDCSYAFRSGIDNKKIFNHHEAIRDIIKYNQKRANSIYVAECDIKKFYDCVSHSVIREIFAEFVKRAQTELNIQIDKRAIRIFYSYLNCFSFNNDVYKKSKELLLTYGIKEGSIPWVTIDELVEVGTNPDIDNIGVPQGGALSCLIANIILDSVDRKVLASNENIFYARFCDDMILMHSDKDICEGVFLAYQGALTKAKLICHKPNKAMVYGSEFWDTEMKSKSPYRWAPFTKHDIETNANVPWVSFVGYQIRYDNIVRIRKTSIKNELIKQVNETNNIIKVIKKTNKVTINKRAIVFRLQQRLISMAVGRIELNKPFKMCWVAGFNVIKENKNIRAQFIRLDRNREKQIKRMIKFTNTNNMLIEPRSPKRRVKQLDYYGSRYSYHQQFI